MKIVLLLGLLAALANAAPPMGMGMGMPPMMMSPAMMMGGMIPPEAMSMIKNLKPEDIKEAIKNMPPEMKEMVKGMGISEEQLDQAVKNLPEDLTPMLDDITKKLENGEMDDLMKTDLSEVKIPEDMKKDIKNQAFEALRGTMADMGLEIKGKNQAFEALRGTMADMGLEIKDNEDIDTVLDKAKKALGEQLKEEGIDLDDPEGMQAKLMAEMRKVTGATPDESDEEVKAKVAKQLLSEMKKEGFNVDPEKPEEAMETLKTNLKDVLKKMDIELDDDAFTPEKIPELLQKVIMTGKLGSPMHVMMSAMASVSNGPQEMPVMMQPPMPMRGYGPPPMGYVSGAEDALFHVFGGDDEVMQNLMAVREGAMRGVLDERALFGLMKDLMHYRIEARVLMAQNRMLEERLAANEMTSLPPYRHYGVRMISCRH